MLYNLYEMQPNSIQQFSVPKIKYWMNGKPILN
jgi:hypothetical protein